MNRIETPKISEILENEFMKPNSVSAYRLAHDIDVPVPASRIFSMIGGKLLRTLLFASGAILGLTIGIF